MGHRSYVISYTILVFL